MNKKLIAAERQVEMAQAALRAAAILGEKSAAYRQKKKLLDKSIKRFLKLVYEDM